MMVYLYRWRLNPARVEAFQQAWSAVTQFLRHSGSQGSRLHLGSDGIHYGYAQWPSRELRELAPFDHPDMQIFRAVMNEAIIERFPEIELEPVADFLTVSPVEHQIRIARPTRCLDSALRFYRDALGLQLLGRFENHAGFDGAMLGHPNTPYHLEFTCSRLAPLTPTPTPEDLVIFYESDFNKWNLKVAQMISAGYPTVPSHNPYWDRSGKTFEDGDGYRVVHQQGHWPNNGKILSF